MYFYRNKGQQCLDLRGNLILSRNDSLITAEAKMIAPTYVRNEAGECAFYTAIKKRPFWQRVQISWIALRFVWGK